ncbi:MAG: RidA family protein [Cellulosilyticaceae bacterium]
MTKQVISTEKAPKAIGPYSQAVVVGDMLYASGQLGLDPETMELAETVEEQAHQALKNVKEVLAAAGTSIDKVFKTTVFLADMNDFAKVNEVYAQYFVEPFPARSAVEVARLPKDAKVEVEIIALTK